MRGVLVVYIMISMFLTVAETSGYRGSTYNTGVNVTTMQDDIDDLGYEYTNKSSITQPARAVVGFLNVYLGIAANSLIFNFVIVGAPDVVNFFVASVFGIMAWIAFYDFMTVALGILVGVLGRIL